jgi:hypothetical protein
VAVKTKTAYLTTGDVDYLRDCGELHSTIGKLKFVGKLRKKKKYRCV